jgi:Uncharacterised nucleotidyltransferase
MKIGQSTTAQQTVRSLAHDLVGLEVVEALREAGIEARVLKGPALVDWLFDDGSARPYADCDVLVSPADYPRTHAVLDRLGFASWLDPTAATPLEGLDDHARQWQRGGDAVEVHWRVPGIGAPAADAWTVLGDHAATVDVAGRPLPVFDRTVRALHVVLHSAHHDPGHPGTRRDLERLLDRLDAAEWPDIVALGHRLAAAGALGEGLRRSPRGTRVADAHGLLAPAPDLATTLRRSQAPRGTLGLSRVLHAEGGRVETLLELCFPPPGYMHARFPFSRRGRRALLATYAARLASRAIGLPRSALALRRARRGRTPP